MSFENNSSRYPEVSGELNMRERILVRSATIIDERSRREKHRHGLLFSSDWIDLDDAVNYHLEALGERRSPEEIDFTYNLVGYNIQASAFTHDFSYSTYSPKLLKRNERGKYRRCKPEEIDLLLHCLDTAPTNDLPSQANEQFIAMMHVNEIRDDRLSTQFKRRVRKLGRFTLGQDE